MRPPVWIAAGMLALIGFAASVQPPAPSAQGSGLDEHNVVLATSADGLDWTRAETNLIEQASVPDAIVTPEGRLRVYYVDSSEVPSTLNCAEIVDGRVEVLDCAIEGQPTVLALDPSIVRRKGRYRLYYYAAIETDVGSNNAHTIRLAVSKDGIHFKDKRAVFTYPGLVDPDVFRAGGRWLMFVFSLADGATVVSESRRGNRFEYAGPLSLQGYGTTSPIKLGKGRFRLFAFRQGEQRSFVSFRSDDGLDWTQEPGTRLLADPGEEVTDPQVVRTDDGWQMVFKTSPAP